MARSLLPNGTLLGMAKLTFNEHPDGELGEALGKLADALGATSAIGLDAVIVVVPKGQGDELHRIVQQRLYGRHQPREL